MRKFRVTVETAAFPHSPLVFGCECENAADVREFYELYFENCYDRKTEWNKLSSFIENVNRFDIEEIAVFPIGLEIWE